MEGAHKSSRYDVQIYIILRALSRVYLNYSGIGVKTSCTHECKNGEPSKLWIFKDRTSPENTRRPMNFLPIPNPLHRTSTRSARVASEVRRRPFCTNACS